MRAALMAVSLALSANAQTPSINAGGVVNAASYAPGGIAPGSIVCIFGTNLADATVSAGALPLATALGSVSEVTFGGVPAPLYFVSAGQINAQAPWEVTAGPVDVVVTTSKGSSAAVSVPILAAAPGIFTTPANGLGQAIATDNSDGSIAAPAGSVPGYNTHAVQAGSYLVIWCTGLGTVDTPVANGTAPEGVIVNTVIQPVVWVGGVQATLVYSVLSPQYAGEYQIAVQVPQGVIPGTTVPLQIQAGGVTTAASVWIAVGGG